MSDIVSTNLARTKVYVRSTGQLLGRATSANRPIVALLAPSNSPVEGANATFTVTLNKLWDADITLDWTTSNGSAVAGTDYGTEGNVTPPSGTATIAAGALSATISIPTIARANYQAARGFTLTISNAATSPGGLPITIEADTNESVIILDSDQPSGDHGYFESLIARPDYWKALSFRPIPGRPQYYASGDHAGKEDPYYGLQLHGTAVGGYQQNAAAGQTQSVTYNPTADADAAAQDAAKIIIPPWGLGAKYLYEEMTIDATTMRFQADGVTNGPSYDGHATFKIENEIVVTTGPKSQATATVGILRGQYGTTPAAHAANTVYYRANNSLPHQVRFPLGTTASGAESTFYTWDVYYTTSWLRQAANGETVTDWLENHKAFQFTANKGGEGSIWMEPATRFRSSGYAPSPAPGFSSATAVCEADWRTYMQPSTLTAFDPLQPNKLHADYYSKYPLRPMNTTFIVYPNKWTRHFVHFEQVLDDYDLMNYWIADEDRAPVQMFTNLRCKAYLPGNVNGSIRQWWLEMDTSQSYHFRLDERNLVTYIRNFCALKTPIGDVAALLVQP